jgi:hypothetical protein
MPRCGGDPMANFSFIKKALPWLGTAASLAATAVPGAGPIVAIATKLLSSAISQPVTPASMADVLTQALGDPAQLASLKQAEMAFQQAMQQMNYTHESDMEAIAEKDRDSARQMQVQTKSYMPAFLSVLAVLTLGFCIYMVGFRVLQPSGHDAMLMLLGAVIAIAKDVYGYFFGSSAGSAAKNDIIANQQNNGPH